MALASGTRLGPYQIVQPLGAGGMGEVYKARDTRLDRTVAIKVLPAHVAADPSFRARFEREARVVSGLDHPNICVLYDVGHEAGVEFLVMQYLEGETLAARLTRGPLPLDQVLRHAIEIADALDKAHRAGVLHRDLKPGNVVLTKSGAKLLDFGLAKLTTTTTAGDLGQSSPATLTSPLTGQGTILGTLLYMSPEQLEGRDLDPRSDIFSFGAVLYEMATGVRPFAGNSQASVIGAILEREPAPLTSHLPLAPASLDRVVRKCLAKDPERRWQSARDLADELSWIAQSSGIREPAAPAPPAGLHVTRRAATTAVLVTGFVLLAAAIGASRYLRSNETPAMPRHFALPSPPGAHFVRGGLAVSPDGSTVAYVAASASPTQNADHAGAGRLAEGSHLYVRRLDSDTTTAIPGTEGAITPFFSPDGLWIGYFTESALMKVSVLGGTPVRIVGTPPVTRGGTWGADDTIIFTPTQSQGLLRVPAAGGAVQTLTTVDTAAGDGPHLWPHLLPDGRNVLFTIRRGTTEQMDQADIAVLSLAGGKPRVVLRAGAYAQYSPTGHLLFVRGRTVMAIGFDATTLETKGTAVPIADDLLVSPWVGGAHYAVTRDGSLLYLRGTITQERPVPVWVDSAGKPAPTPTIVGAHLQGPRLSPDGGRALFNDTSGRGDDETYVCDLSRGTLVALSADPGDDFDPIWNQDGTRVIWTSFRSGTMPTLVWRAADGSTATEPVVQSAPGASDARVTAQFAGSVSPDGILAFTYAAQQSSDIWIVPLTGSRIARKFIGGEAKEYGPEFSPDGKWIAYVSNEAGPFDVYVAPYPGPGARKRITTGGGLSPAWSRDGTRLFYQTDAGLAAVGVDAKSSGFVVGDPHVLFKGNYRNFSREDGPREYDVARDGRHFLMMRVDPPADAPATLNVILNWPAELARRSNPDKR